MEVFKVQGPKMERCPRHVQIEANIVLDRGKMRIKGVAFDTFRAKSSLGYFISKLNGYPLVRVNRS